MKQLLFMSTSTIRHLFFFLDEKNGKAFALRERERAGISVYNSQPE
jgi:hypothetical protein